MSVVSLIAGVIASALVGIVLTQVLKKHVEKGSGLLGISIAIVIFLVVQIVADQAQTDRTTSSVSGPASPGAPDAVQNLSLGISNPSLDVDGSTFSEIEVTGGTPGAGVDIEIAQPSYVEGGVCPKITPPITDKCNLVYGGGGTFDREGKVVMKFPDPADIQLYSGLYRVAVRDQHTGAVVDSEISVN
ncbi:hypothetical protein [Microbacterium sp. B19]|uniref:hypothetical protein n=1 Tax=Microbacterium sp. B19 TaxID=96765 RepID=UPI0004772E8E|nr:hypothetical protein [Microbacterium sp. B19]